MALSVSSNLRDLSRLPGLFNEFVISGTILGYIFYWIAVMVTLLILKRRGTLSALVRLRAEC